MAWDDERVEKLKKLWAEGLSASQIAGKIGGVTRNAVIGKVHRLGLSGRAAPAKPQRGRAYCADEAGSRLHPPSSEGPKPLATEPEFTASAILDDGDLTTVATLKTNMCKWPVGDPASDDFHFCGQAAPTGKSYCPYHASLAFQPTQQRKVERRHEPASLPAAGERKRIAS